MKNTAALIPVRWIDWLWPAFHPKNRSY